MGLFESKKKGKHETRIDFSTLSDYQASPNPTALPPQAALGSVPTPPPQQQTQSHSQSQLPHQQPQQHRGPPGGYPRGPPVPPRATTVMAPQQPQVVFVPIPINTQAYGYPPQVMAQPQPYYQGMPNQYMQGQSPQQRQYIQQPQQRATSQQQQTMMGQSPNRQTRRVTSDQSHSPSRQQQQQQPQQQQMRRSENGYAPSTRQSSSANNRPNEAAGRIATSPYRTSNSNGSSRNEFLNRAQQPSSNPSRRSSAHKDTESERSIYSSPTSMGFETSNFSVSSKLRVPTISLDRDDDRTSGNGTGSYPGSSSAIDRYMEQYGPSSSRGRIDLMYEITELRSDNLNSQNRTLQSIYKSLIDEETRIISAKRLRDSLVSRHGSNTDLRVAENLIDHFGNREIGFEFANFVKLCKFLYKCKISFDYTDADQSGYLDFKEFLQCLEDNRFYIDEEQAFQLYDNIPRKKNQLGIYEYISVILFILHQRESSGI